MFSYQYTCAREPHCDELQGDWGKAFPGSGVGRGWLGRISGAGAPSCSFAKCQLTR